MSKKTIWAIVAVAVLVVVGAVFWVNANKEKNVEGTLMEIMAKVYAGISEENLPGGLANIQLNAENAQYYIGTTEVDYKEAMASESMIGSIPHSVVLVRLNDAKDAAEAVAKIKENVNPRKWICVQASNVVVESKGDLVVLIMCDTEMTQPGQELAPKLEANFNNL